MTAVDTFDWLLDSALTETEFLLLVARLDGDARQALAEEIRGLRPPPQPWVPLPYQIPPSLDEPWAGFVVIAGRGTGKTATIVRWLDDHMNGPA